MRDTSRLQVIAVTLIGACAWLSLDFGSLKSAFGGLISGRECDLRHSRFRGLSQSVTPAPLIAVPAT